MKTKSALSYFGSDSEVAPRLAAMLDDCKHVTIPFCGGMSILPHLKARAVVANDLHDLAINFYCVLADRCGAGSRDELIRRCQATLSHPAELEHAQSLLTNGLLEASFIERAWAFWALCWISRKGKGGTKNQGGMPSVRRTATGGTNASRVRAAADDLAAWAKHFERCEFESVDFRKLIPKIADDPSCGIYCDPPWVDAGENYLRSFTEKDHRELYAMLTRFAHARIVLRYGDSPLIRELYEHWNITEATSRDQCNAVKGEIWITRRVG